MSAKHTQGPYSFDDGDSDMLGIFAANGEPLAYLVEPRSSTGRSSYYILPRDEVFEKACVAREHGVPVVYSRNEERIAIARLFASAPDNFDVSSFVKLIADRREGKVPTQGQWEKLVGMARAAISKATGEA